jgi:hypothetical protein
MSFDGGHSTGPLKRKIDADARKPAARAKCGGIESRQKLEAGKGHALEATIVAVLDRDSELRHDYLLKRWQGLVA